MRLRSDRSRGVLMVLVGVFVLSPDALILRLVGTDRWSLIFWRGLLTALTLLICFVAIYRRDVFKYLGAIGRYGLVGGFISATSSILFVTSIVLTSVANTLVIISAAPLFTAISSRMFLRESVPARTCLAIFATLVGITTIFSGSLGGGTLLGDQPVYITFDIDGLDQIYAPGTGAPEPGGPSFRGAQVMPRPMQGLNLIAADVNECAPPLDPTGNTALVAANLMFEELCLPADSVHRRSGR